MKLQTIIDNLPQIISYLFGAGGVLAFFKGRKERQIAIKLGETNAVQGMQVAYDSFIKHSSEVVNQLQSEVKELHNQLCEIKKDFEDYKSQCKIKH
jgi:hypothetical protein